MKRQKENKLTYIYKKMILFDIEGGKFLFSNTTFKPIPIHT